MRPHDPATPFPGREPLVSGSPLVQQLEKAYHREPVPTLVLIGAPRSGRSTTLGALFAKGGPLRPAESAPEIRTPFEPELRKGTRGVLRVFELPEPQEATAHRYADVLDQADAVLWVLDTSSPGTGRLGSGLEALADDPSLPRRLVVGLAKGELADEDGWDPSTREPSAAQEELLHSLARRTTALVKEAVPAWRGRTVVYSAAERYGLLALLIALVEAAPFRRRWMLERRADPADVLELVDPELRELLAGKGDHG